MDILVELAPGSHRVPAGGLRLSAEHTPSSTRHTVTWRCADGPGSCSVHGGQAVERAAGLTKENGTKHRPVEVVKSSGVVVLLHRVQVPEVGCARRRIRRREEPL